MNLGCIVARMGSVSIPDPHVMNKLERLRIIDDCLGDSKTVHAYYQIHV